MHPQIYINLPVKDLQLSTHFYQSLGFSVNEQFSDETATAMVISSTIFLMLLTMDKFKSFTYKKIVDAHQQTEVINALNLQNREQVDAMYDRAILSGGMQFHDTVDNDHVYTKSFVDPDGHVWEVFYMDMHIE